MAQQAKRPDVIEVALAAALHNGNDVVRLPKTATAGDTLHPVEPQAGFACGAAGALQRSIGCQGVDPAYGTASAIARKDLIAQITGVGAETPLVHAVVAAEGATAPGDDLKLAPPAKWQAIRSAGKVLAAGMASWKCA
jgi:hypothetical protein